MRFAFVLSFCCSIAFVEPLPAAAPVDFVRDVRPLLSNSCFACHGADEKARKADLRLDVRDAAVKAGSIVPGKPEGSELVRRLTTDDADEHMPPAKAKKPEFTKGQVELVKRWIAEGAKYSEHWAFTKLARRPCRHGKRTRGCATPSMRSYSDACAPRASYPARRRTASRCSAGSRST